MATRKLVMCRYPGCKKLIPYGQKYCEEHQKPQLHLCSYPGCKELTTTKYCEFHMQVMKDKENEASKERHKKYSRNWRKLSKWIRNQEPFCRECLKRGIYTPSQCVDHIDEDPTNNKRDNLQALCWSCHSRKTLVEQNKRRSKGGGVKS